MGGVAGRARTCKKCADAMRPAQEKTLTAAAPLRYTLYERL